MENIAVQYETIYTHANESEIDGQTGFSGNFLFWKIDPKDLGILDFIFPYRIFPRKNPPPPLFSENKNYHLEISDVIRAFYTSMPYI